MTSSAGRHARHDVLARGGGRAPPRHCSSGISPHDQGRHLLRQLVAELGARRRASTLAAPSSLAAASATGRQPAPATSTCTSPPSALAALMALATAGARALLSCSASRRTVMTERPGLLQLGDELGGVGHLDAGLAARRLHRLEHLEARRDVDAVVGRLLHLERLLLGLHDVGQRGIARLVETQVGGDDGRQLQLRASRARRRPRASRAPSPPRSPAWRRTWPAASRAAPPASGRSGCSRRRSPACRG